MPMHFGIGIWVTTRIDARNMAQLLTASLETRATQALTEHEQQTRYQTVVMPTAELS